MASSAPSRPRQPSLPREAYLVAEIARLYADPIYYGAGVPRGDGRYVAVLPGLFANDWYLQPLRTWLDRIGYRSVRSTLSMNVGCPQRLTLQIEEELRRRRGESGRKIALIGHSRGGILARAIAARLQDDCSHLILLGSPVGGILRTPGWGDNNAGGLADEVVADASRRARQRLDPDCNVPYCGCPFPEDLRAELAPTTSVISIYSTDDPIVPAAACRLPGARNFEVRGTHSGLAFNRGVYRALATVLQD